MTKYKLFSGILKLTTYNSKNCDFENFQEYFQCFTLCTEILELGGYISILNISWVRVNIYNYKMYTSQVYGLHKISKVRVKVKDI